ncbi:MAG: hypothetical protein JW723_08800 [Bacteroidales bacterium]|nr:hypothetical protein [Bacteroidales bacterium]
MDTFQTRKTIYVLSVSVIILFSFFHHSSLFSPVLNADDAVLVLMIHDFHLPGDIYYWGANRGGTIIPLIGQFFHKIMHLPALTSESLARYLIHVIGFLGLTSLFRSNPIKIVFAVVWFLPPLRMLDVLKVSFAQQYALTGMAICLMSFIQTGSAQKHHLKHHLLLFLIVILFIMSVWVSDLAVVTIFIILFIQLVFDLKKDKTALHYALIRKPGFYYVISGLVAGGFFIFYAKRNAIYVNDYFGFFDMTVITGAFKIFAGTMADLFLFRIKEPFTSLYTYLILIFLLFFLFKKKDIKYTGYQLKWTVVFLLDLAVVFTVIITSKWAYLNGIPRRYFVCNYISFWMVFLLTFESLKKIKYQRILYCLLMGTVMLGGLGTIYNFRYVSPRKLTPAAKTVSEFENLGKIGIIAEYWNSYLSSVTNPAMIKATPNDKSEVRNQRLVDSVFARPEIYVIRDMWMESFPDTLEQFGYVLLKNGDEFRTGGCHVCNYKKIKLNKQFDPGQFRYNGAVKYDDITAGEVMCVSADCDTCKEKHFVYGPYIPIGTGKFTARFYIRASGYTGNNPVALIDVTADYGVTQLAAKTLDHASFSNDGFHYVDLDFETMQRYHNLEFRIYYYCNADLCFSHVKLKER